ncbi:MAG TPA: hypothetical protein VKT49_23630 [Bryobacteraceae bacterium]|nr:hypothetical protein [Bryobacteraceae bacterium]
MDAQKQTDLGSWSGLQQAFAIVTGSCAAARAQCLRQVRDSKMLDDLGLTWDEFCRQHVGISRRHADSLIRQHADFGDAYFRLSEIARISPRTFRHIAAAVNDESIEIDGEKIALTSANAARIRAAIRTLANRARPAPGAPRPPADLIELQIRIDAIADDLDKSLRHLNPLQSRTPHRSLIAYAANKFRVLARRADAEPEPPAPCPA